MPHHVMLDLETRGVTPGAALVSIGAAVFDAEHITGRFYATITLESCLAAALIEEEATLSWWRTQPEDVQSVLTDPHAVPLDEALDRFDAFLRVEAPNDRRIWGNGANFDPPLLEAA